MNFSKHNSLDKEDEVVQHYMYYIYIVPIYNIQYINIRFMAPIPHTNGISIHVNVRSGHRKNHNCSTRNGLVKCIPFEWEIGLYRTCILVAIDQYIDWINGHIQYLE